MQITRTSRFNESYHDHAINYNYGYNYHDDYGDNDDAINYNYDNNDDDDDNDDYNHIIGYFNLCETKNKCLHLPQHSMLTRQ